MRNARFWFRKCRWSWPRGPFPVQPWPAIVDRFAELVEIDERFRPMLDVATSVVAEGASEKLVAHTSMHDLVVATAPTPDTPCDAVRIGLGVGRLRQMTGGGVTIEHESITGPNDRITRPSAEVLPLFWRFMIEKYGVHPDRDPVD